MFIANADIWAFSGHISARSGLCGELFCVATDVVFLTHSSLLSHCSLCITAVNHSQSTAAAAAAAVMCECWWLTGRCQLSCAPVKVVMH